MGEWVETWVNRWADGWVAGGGQVGTYNFWDRPKGRPHSSLLPTFRIWRLLAPSMSYQRATAVLDSGMHPRGLADSLAHRKPTWLMFS